jgi:hypothetical protein
VSSPDSCPEARLTVLIGRMAQHGSFNDFWLSLRTVRSYAPPQDRWRRDADDRAQHLQVDDVFESPRFTDADEALRQ